MSFIHLGRTMGKNHGQGLLEVKMNLLLKKLGASQELMMSHVAYQIGARAPSPPQNPEVLYSASMQRPARAAPLFHGGCWEAHPRPFTWEDLAGQVLTSRALPASPGPRQLHEVGD